MSIRGRSSGSSWNQLFRPNWKAPGLPLSHDKAGRSPSTGWSLSSGRVTNRYTLGLAKRSDEDDCPVPLVIHQVRSFHASVRGSRTRSPIELSTTGGPEIPRRETHYRLNGRNTRRLCPPCVCYQFITATHTGYFRIPACATAPGEGDGGEERPNRRRARSGVSENI